MLFRHKHPLQSPYAGPGRQAVSGTERGPQAGAISAASAAAGQPAEIKPGELTVDGRTGAAFNRLALATSLAAVLAFVLLITVPFIAQPLHIDDAIFWDFARANLEHPFRLHLDDYPLMGKQLEVWRDTHPPLNHLYLSLVMAATGSESVEPLHLGFAIFPLITGVSMFFLARRFVRSALLAVAMLLATPALMIMSHTLMADGPMLALWLAATAAYIYGVDRDDRRLLAASGALAALALSAGYQAAALVLLLPLYALLAGRLSHRTAWPLLLPVAGFGFYCIYNLAQYGALPRFKHAGGLSLAQSHVLERFQGTLLQLGGASIFPPLMAAVFSVRNRRYLALPVVGAAAAAIAALGYGAGRFPASSAILFAFFLTAGGMMLLAVIADTATGVMKMMRRSGKADRADSDRLFLGAWLLSVLGMIVVLLPHATAKYTLPLLAPLVLLFFLDLEAALPYRRVKAIATAGLVLTLITGALLSAADYRLALANRDFARSFADRRDVAGSVWFVGEWGFRHYMEEQGYRYLTSDDESPQAGDLVVRAEFSDWPLAARVQQQMQLVETGTIEWQVPLRVMNFEANAGFYGTYWGDLPYAFTSDPVERFEIYRIRQRP